MNAKLRAGRGQNLGRSNCQRKVFHQHLVEIRDGLDHHRPCLAFVLAAKIDRRRTPPTAHGETQSSGKRPQLRGGNRAPSHDAPSRDNSFRDRAACLDPAEPPVRLEGQSKDADRVQQRAGLDPHLRVCSRLVPLRRSWRTVMMHKC